MMMPTQTQSRPNHRRPRILLGITGSVAAVKGPKLALRLAREVNADVRVVLTRTVEQYFWKEGRAVSSYDAESWKDFLASTSKSTKIEEDSEDTDSYESSNGRISLHYAEEEWKNYKSLQDTVLHIDLRNWADICLIAPLSAHTLGKIANGLCDDLLSCIMRAWDFGQRFPSNTDTINSRGKPVILAPAMNTAMWYHPLTKNQLEAIKKFASPDAKSNNYHGNAGTGVTIVEPATKTLACGEIGAGALADLDDIMYEVKKCLVQIGLLELLQMTNCDIRKNNFMNQSSSSSSKESIKRALLRCAKQRFDAMRESHEQGSMDQDQNPSVSRLAAPISPTPNMIIEAFLPRLNIDPTSLLVDLGCGDGRWLFAANAVTNCRCLGVDVDEVRLTIARNQIRNHKLQDVVQVRRQDVFEFVKESEEILAANVIVLYLFREAVAEMSTLLRQRLCSNKNGKESGTSLPTIVQILSVGFTLTGWTAEHEEKIGSIRVYLYVVK